MSEDDFDLDILGQQSSLNLYTQLCYSFPVADDFLNATIVDILAKGLERLSASFPWLAGKIVNEGLSENNTGTFKILPTKKVPLIANDLRHDSTAPTMKDLREAEFPMRMLDENMICPRKTMLRASPVSPSNFFPVFIVQVNLIEGGLLLCMLSHHQAMDMVGQGQVMHLLSKACRDEVFTGEELAIGNLKRANLISLFDELWQPSSENAEQAQKSVSTSDSSTKPPPPECTWAYFGFEAASLAALKVLAVETLPPSSKYISTDDVLTVFVWQAIARTRLSRLDDMTESTLGRAVDVRRYMKVPATYPGLMTNKVQHTCSLQKLISEPMGSLASQLRAAINPQTSQLGHDTKALATLLSRTLGKSPAKPSATSKRDLGRDVSLSSWAKVDCYALDFGLGLGKPECVRRPRFDTLEGLVYFMPRASDGDIAVAICLRDEDMKELRKDDDVVKYARYIG